MKVLVIAPHPDDEVLGCGGTIANHVKAGNAVHLCIVTRAYTPEWNAAYCKKKPQEIARAARVLGIKKIHQLDFLTVKLDTYPQKELNDALFKVIATVKPDILYIPHSGDLNRDHRLVHEASLVAARPTFHKIKKILAYEILSETEWGLSISPFVPTVYEDITTTLQAKLNAMKAYASELRRKSHPRSLEIIKVLTRKRGAEVGLKYAEAYMLIREIR